MRGLILAKKRTLKGLIIGLLLILVGVAGAGFGLWRLGSTWLENSRWSRLERVQVAGLVRVTERDVLRAANLKAGMNIMQLPLEAIASRVERVPGVRSARVLRKIPHRVQIRI